MTDALQVPIQITETAGLDRLNEAVRLGVPLAKGQLHEATRVVLMDASGQRLPTQTRALVHWPDRSIKWLLVDSLVSLRARQWQALTLRAESPAEAGSGPPVLQIEARPGRLTIDTGVLTLTFAESREDLFEVARHNGDALVASPGVRLRLLGCGGREYRATVARLQLEERGPIRCAVVAEGEFHAAARRSALQFRARCVLTAGSAGVRLELRLHNPRAAIHPGGLWDLDDRGTVLFEDLSLLLGPARPVEALHWYAERVGHVHTDRPTDWLLYQDSSGGENWDSPNHVDGHGLPTVSFRGYRVTCGEASNRMLVAEGDRATPCLCTQSASGAIAASVADFWQNFPKALRWQNEIGVGLFPGECRTPFALQGGEQKRHTVLLEFPLDGRPVWIPARQQPLVAVVDPAWTERSGALSHFAAAVRDPNRAYLNYVGAIVEGPHAFAAKREIIDEYGWRNYGDLYADHEAVGHAAPRPLVSHFNNQYDFVFGASIHHLRTGDVRWRELAEAAALHTIDIDIYHTDRDKAAFNHGLFWHTDHYKPAATCTHRTYSRRNGKGRLYGGGPSSEHNYTSGLLLYYWLSGDPEAAGAVRELADWVIAMDDGTRSILGLIDPGATGLASQTAEPTYHKAGRGAGNSINALLDAYQLCGERRYLDKAEGLIRRCIHPADDIEALQLRDPERRWSYLAFLQVLGKYLELKAEWNEGDYPFHYARASLLRYARWMAVHEVPFRQVLDRVALPTETWPAQDIRKCHVLHLAAWLAPSEERTWLHQRAELFFERAVADVLSFETAFS